LKKKLRSFIDKYKPFAPGSHIIVGLSGGADSVALLHVLLTQRDAYELTLSAVHVNHGLREAARDDESFVTELCGKWEIPLRIFHVDVRFEAQTHGQTIEETARRLRYGCFEKALGEMNGFAGKSVAIATAHNRDDSAETVLLNLIRGAGLKGLCGIPPVRQINGGTVIRPLLEISRNEIEAYLNENNLSCRTDESNADETYARNRIRHTLLPYIAKHLNPQAAEVFARNALALREDEAFLESLTCGAYKQCQTDKGLDINILTSLPAALVRRVIRYALGNKPDIDGGHINQVIELLHKATGRETYLPGDTVVRREYGRLVIATAKPMPSGGFCYILEPCQPLFIPPLNKTVLLTLSPQEGFAKSFSYDKIRTGLCLRTRRNGDRIYFAGVGTRKLQDYLTDTKTPRSQRDMIPLLADGSDILWIMDSRSRVNGKYEYKPESKGCWLSLLDEGGT
jgi:tRNA(Ile)-lysidine synthase